jgi:hypothetical protein
VTDGRTCSRFRFSSPAPSITFPRRQRELRHERRQETVLLRVQEEGRHEPLRLRRRQAAAAAPGAGLPRASPGRRPLLLLHVFILRDGAGEPPLPERLEAQSVQDLEGYAAYRAEEATRRTQGCLKIAEEMRDTASNTLVTVHQQGQQVRRTHMMAIDIDQDLSSVRTYIVSE